MSAYFSQLRKVYENYVSSDFMHGVSSLVNMLHSILLFCIALLSIVYILHQCLTAFSTHHKRALKKECDTPPKYPQKGFLLGLDVLRDIISAVHSQRYLKTIQHTYKQYGNTFSKRILFSSIICTIEPANIKAVLSTQFKDYGITSVRKDVFRPFLGHSILTADGDEWAPARARLRPSFSKTSYVDLELFELHVRDLVKAIRCAGAVVDLKDLLLCLTTDITTHSMYGESVDSLKSGASSTLMEALHEAQYGCEHRARWGKLVMLLSQRKFNGSVKILQQYMEQQIEKVPRHCQLQGSESALKAEGRHVLLHEIGHWISDTSRLRDELLTILVAGRDTTASLLCSFFFTVARRPDVWLQLRAEVDRLHGEKPTLEQLKQMQYVKYCLNETLRLYPPLPHNARVAVRDTILPTGGGPDGRSPIFIPAGTQVELHISALHRRHDLWGEDADEYRPERWGKDIPPWQYLAFSGGPRNCIGQQFGYTVALYTTVRLIQEFEGLEATDSRPWTEELGVVCFPANGVTVSVTADRRRDKKIQ